MWRCTCRLLNATGGSHEDTAKKLFCEPRFHLTSNNSVKNTVQSLSSCVGVNVIKNRPDPDSGTLVYSTGIGPILATNISEKLRSD